MCFIWNIYFSASWTVLPNVAGTARLCWSQDIEGSCNLWHRTVLQQGPESKTLFVATYIRPTFMSVAVNTSTHICNYCPSGTHYFLSFFFLSLCMKKLASLWKSVLLSLRQGYLLASGGFYNPLLYSYFYNKCLNWFIAAAPSHEPQTPFPKNPLTLPTWVRHAKIWVSVPWNTLPVECLPPKTGR
jgi:hypothetical protein